MTLRISSQRLITKIALLSIGAILVFTIFLMTACGSSDDSSPAAESGADASSDSAKLDSGARDAAKTSTADACAAPDADLGGRCEAGTDCSCGAICAATQCMPAAACDEAILSWVGPTSNDDGTCLTDLAGFTIQWGMSDAGDLDRKSVV